MVTTLHEAPPLKRDAQSGDGRRRRALIIVQNLPVPFDRRVWLESQALHAAGWQVHVISPKGPRDLPYELHEGVHLYRYRPFPPTQRKIGFLLEYAYSFFLTFWLTVKVWRRHGVDVIQACNPPDIFWPIGLLFRRVAKAKFVYDQHDLCPELYESRFQSSSSLPKAALRLLERCTYSAADHVIATNESYRATAINRGRKSLAEVTIVRNGPDAARLRPQAPELELRRGRRFLVSYIGVMGPQDGVDIVLRSAATIVHELGRKDIAFTLIGAGDCFEDLKELAGRLELTDCVQFTGRVPDDQVLRILSSSHLGLSPDPKNPLNDVSTMNKTMEYMAFGLPVVAFDLLETRFSAQAAAAYVEPNDELAYANTIVDLLDDEPRRRAMGKAGRERALNSLAWQHQRRNFVDLYSRLVGDPSPRSMTDLASAER